MKGNIKNEYTLMIWKISIKTDSINKIQGVVTAQMCKGDVNV